MDTTILFNAVNIFTRYLAKIKVDDDYLSPVAGVSLQIAAKVASARSSFVLRDVPHAVNCRLSIQQLTTFEIDILNRLDFLFTPVTMKSFVRIFTRLVRLTARQTMMVFYLLELALADMCLVRVNPSLLCAAACAVALKLGGQPWPRLASHYMGYEPAALMGVCQRLVFLHEQEQITQSVSYQRFSNAGNHKVSLVRCPVPFID